MSYEPTNWKSGDKVTSTRLNKIEQGIQGNDEEITALKEGLSDITEQTENLVTGILKNRSVSSNGKLSANAGTDVFKAPVESGKTYQALTSDSNLIFAFYESDPFDPNAISYNASRTIQNLGRGIIAPITGFIAIRMVSDYATPQLTEGSNPVPYIKPISAVDAMARNALSKALVIDNADFTVYDNKYANARNITLSDYTGLKAVEFPVFGGLKFNYQFTVSTVGAIGLFFVDCYGNNISPIEAQTATQTITSPDFAVKCFATVNNVSDIQFVDMVLSIISRNETYTAGLKATTTPLEIIDDNTGMLDLFLHVGCIGDSLASGESYWNDGGTVQGQDFYQYSWGQFLARKTGNTYYNWSKGGLMAKTWLESEYAIECFDGNHKCEAYIIGLGQNDRNHSVTIGTSADIDLTDYHNNADTFYGNYGKIIQKIKEIQPQAKIFVVTDPNPYVNRDGYNVPIADMATIFDNVYLIDMFTYGSKYYNNPIIQAQMRGSHYNAYGYKLYAMMIANYINWIITKNYTEFTQVELIGTGHSWTD